MVCLPRRLALSGPSAFREGLEAIDPVILSGTLGTVATLGCFQRCFDLGSLPSGPRAVFGVLVKRRELIFSDNCGAQVGGGDFFQPAPL